MMPNAWDIFGLTGQCLFGSRFFVQWVYSERRKESHIPIVFWYLSIFGGLILLMYAIHIQNFVFILGQSTGIVVYLRNLILIYGKKNKVVEESNKAKDSNEV